MATVMVMLGTHAAIAQLIVKILLSSRSVVTTFAMLEIRRTPEAVSQD